MKPASTPLDPLSRRKFLALSSMLPVALLAPSTAVRAIGAAEPVAPTSVTPVPRKKYYVGLELYSVRGSLSRDLPDTLRAVAQMGYESVEFYAPYFDWSLAYAKEVRSRLDDHRLRCWSTHNHIDSFAAGAGLAKAIELNQILGARHLILASTPPATEGLEGWKHLGGQLAAACGQLQSHGLAAGFHNHQSEWARIDGERRIMDVIAAETPPEFVLQLDVGTCLEAGADPVAWIKAHPGRIKSVHLKDWAPGKPEDEKSYRVLFGEGVAPWNEIIAAAESVGGV